MNYDDWLMRQHDAWERVWAEEEALRERAAMARARAEAEEEAEWLAHCAAEGLDPETGEEVGA
jgi:hypothetical protein